MYKQQAFFSHTAHWYSPIYFYFYHAKRFYMFHHVIGWFGYLVVFLHLMCKKNIFFMSLFHCIFQGERKSLFLWMWASLAIVDIVFLFFGSSCCISFYFTHYMYFISMLHQPNAFYLELNFSSFSFYSSTSFNC